MEIYTMTLINEFQKQLKTDNTIHPLDKKWVEDIFGPLPAKPVDFRERDRERAREILLGIRLQLDRT